MYIMYKGLFLMFGKKATTTTAKSSVDALLCSVVFNLISVLQA